MHRTRHISMLRLAPLLAVVVLMLAGLFPLEALATSPPPTSGQPVKINQPSGTCTTDSQFNPSPPANGVISNLVNVMTGIIDPTGQGMFGSVIGDSGVIAFAEAACLAYIVLYAIFFMVGMVQVKVHDFVVRIVKVGIIATLISGDSWDFFNSTVVTFFYQGMNDIINEVLSISLGGGAQFQPGSTPFSSLDTAVEQILSAKMAVTLLATVFAGPYGLLIGVIMLIACFLFLKSILSAMWVYLMSLILLSILFGLAPVFIICMMFERTKQLFVGWRSQVLNAALQPVMMFMFFSFFCALLSTCIGNILSNPVCWTDSLQSLRGTPFYMHLWRFEMPGNDGTYQPFAGTYEIDGAYDLQGNIAGPPFPISMISILIFLILAELANRFNSVVTMIARDLADSAVDLSYVKGAFSGWMDGIGGKGSGGDGKGPMSSADQNRYFNQGGGGQSLARQQASAGTGDRP